MKMMRMLKMKQLWKNEVVFAIDEVIDSIVGTIPKYVG